MVIAAAVIVPLGVLFFISGLVVNLIQVWFLSDFEAFFLGLSVFWIRFWCLLDSVDVLLHCRSFLLFTSFVIDSLLLGFPSAEMGFFQFFHICR